jgi:hypothetical protein
MAEAIDAIVTQQPGSKTYRVMTAVAYYAGLRPSEVVMLRVRISRRAHRRLGTPRSHRSRHLLRRTRRTQDRTAQRPHPTRTRRDAARVDRRQRPHFTRAAAVPHPQRHHAQRIELGAGMAPSARISRRENRSASTTAATPPQPPGCAPACPSPKPPDASDTASKHSSPPTSEPSTTKNTSPTNASTPSSDSALVAVPPAAPGGPSRVQVVWPSMVAAAAQNESMTGAPVGLPSSVWVSRMAMLLSDGTT